MGDSVGKIGLDPRKDVHGLTVFGDGSESDATFLIYHTGSPEKLRDLLREKKAGEPVIVEGVAMLKLAGMNGADPVAYAVVEANRPLIMGATGASVARAAKGLGGKGATPAAEWSAAVAGRTPLLVLSAHIDRLPLGERNSGPVRAARSATLVVAESGDLLEFSLKATMVDAASAKNAEAVVKALQVTVLSSPPDGAHKPGVESLLQALKTSTSDKTLSLSLPAALSDLRRCLEVRVDTPGEPAAKPVVSKK